VQRSEGGQLGSAWGLVKHMIIKNINPTQEMDISIIMRIILLGFYIQGNLARIMYLLIWYLDLIELFAENIF
jgi:hypothetical protein